MLQEHRWQRIRQLLSAHRSLTTEALADDLAVSRETIRRDLVQLEAAGELRRVHGGVVIPSPRPEAPLARRHRTHVRQKQALAKAAAGLVTPGQTIFLEGGSSTVQILAERLRRLSGLTLLTNAWPIAIALAQPDDAVSPRHKVVFFGGEPRPMTLATYGQTTINEIHRYSADWAFVSPTALHPVDGAMSHEVEEADIAIAMFRRATRHAVLADASKLGLRGRVSYCLPAQIDHLIVDAAARSTRSLADLAQEARHVIVAE